MGKARNRAGEQGGGQLGLHAPPTFAQPEGKHSREAQDGLETDHSTLPWRPPSRPTPLSKSEANWK